MSLEDKTFRKKPALDKAMDFLARRDHSEKELRQKLNEREYTEEEIERAVEILKDRNHLLPPDELANKWAQSLAKRGKGLQYIQAYLHKKGLPSVSLESDQEFETGLELIERKLGFSPPFSWDVLAKIQRFLQNRGYTYESIKRIMNHEK